VIPDQYTLVVDKNVFVTLEGRRKAGFEHFLNRHTRTGMNFYDGDILNGGEVWFYSGKKINPFIKLDGIGSRIQLAGPSR
jgi:hypothetical protein